MSRCANRCRKGVLGGGAREEAWRWEGRVHWRPVGLEHSGRAGDEISRVRGVGTGQVLQTNGRAPLKRRFYPKSSRFQ